MFKLLRRNGQLWTVVVAFAACLMVQVFGQGITIPNTFVNGTTADANQVNANFTALSSNALNRNAGTMLGQLTSQDVIPDGNGTRDLGSTGTRFRDGWFSRNFAAGGTLTATGAASLGSTLGVTGLSTFTGGTARLWTPVTTTSTGTQNDFDPGSALSAGKNVLIYCNNASALTITGLNAAAAYDGQMVLLKGQNTQVNLSNQSASSTAAYRLVNIAGSADTSFTAEGHALYVYDATNTRWRLVTHEQGAWITPTYNGAHFTGTGGTWTVGATDVSTGTMKYRLVGKTVHVVFAILTTTVQVGTGNLNITNGQWGGYTAVGTQWVVHLLVSDNGGLKDAYMQVGTGASATQIGMSLFGANFLAATDNTNVWGEMFFEVS